MLLCYLNIGMEGQDQPNMDIYHYCKGKFVLTDVTTLPKYQDGSQDQSNRDICCYDIGKLVLPMLLRYLNTWMANQDQPHIDVYCYDLDKLVSITVNIQMTH